ncbi:MAG: AcrB/AcrD/AcrF family protein [Candidatus Latescibacteria bacterium]|nr:AcrB/AcrD/AcrF family protein [Candidatus Latescibacterota bacterium]NIO78022.1 AcrB/AcrD/AcrF family protein [Candidatus Latescibacterota bacterium]
MAVRKPVLTTMIVLAFVVLGIFSWQRLVIDLLPEIEFPFVTITTIYPGAGPGEVETQITKRLEDEVSTISDTKSLESISRENLSFVIIEFELGVDADIKAIEVKDKVDAIQMDLPEDAEPSAVVKFDINAFPIIELAISSPRPLDEVYQTTKDVIKDYLSRVGGVASIDIIGGRQREIQVAVDKKLLKAYGLSLHEIVASIAAENVNIPTGRITEERKEYTLRLLGEFENLEQLRRVRIPLENGSIPLESVAEIIDGFRDQRDLARFNRTPTVAVQIQKRSGANTVEVSDGIYAAIEDLKNILPEDYRIDIASDSSEFIKDAVKDVTQNIFIGIFLTTILLYLFLHTFRVTLVAAVAMPTSVIATFLLIDFAGFTLNILTLMALGITVGILVTNSIVVLENIIRHLQTGKPAPEASIEGTTEISLAVVASTLTNTVVFTPIAFMSGIVGRFFYQFGLTVVFATLFSLLVSFTLTPLLASIFLASRKMGDMASDGPSGASSTTGGARRPGLKKRFETSWNRFYSAVAVLYQGSLERALNRRVRVLAAATLLFFFSLFMMGKVGGEFMPTMDEGYLTIAIEMPAGSSLEETDQVLGEVEEILSKDPETVSILVSIGGPNKGVEDGTVILEIVEKSKRDRGILEYANYLRSKLASIPDAKVRVTVGSGGGGGDEGDISLELTGSDLDVLKRLSEEVYDSVATVRGLAGLKSSIEAEKPELIFFPDRKELDRFGISSAALAMALRTGYEGEVASLYREHDEEYDIRVRYREAERRNRSSFYSTEVRTGDYDVPISQLGSVVPATSQREILRLERQKLVRIDADVASGTLSELVGQIQEKLEDVELPPGYRIDYGGVYEYQQESFASIFTALVLAIILTYMALAGILESFIHPFTVMMTLPLGLVGMALALFITGKTINIFSLMALVMLVGIVVNNAILLLDYTSILRGRGLSRREALLEACPVRLRPIIIANLAIAIGMLPQALGGAGSEFRAVMAIVTMGGVLVSAVFTLYVIPVMYDILDQPGVKIRSWLVRKK